MKRDLSFLPVQKNETPKPNYVCVNVYPEDRDLVRVASKRLGLTMMEACHQAFELWYEDLKAKYKEAEE